MTEPDNTRQLTAGQLNAIDALIGGGSDSEAAMVAKVARQTVCGWRRHNPIFQAELNRRREAVMGETVDKLRALLPMALWRLEEEMTGGPDGWKAAMKLLELAGIGNVGNIGPTDSTDILEARALQERLDKDPLAALDMGMNPPRRDELEDARAILEFEERWERTEAGHG